MTTEEMTKAFEVYYDKYCNTNNEYTEAFKKVYQDPSEPTDLYGINTITEEAFNNMSHDPSQPIYYNGDKSKPAKVCECGSHAVGSNAHSSWCPIS